ncbi:MAG: T9SS type A sorting domain-containing protein [Ignavibacteriaceae bacterium]
MNTYRLIYFVFIFIISDITIAQPPDTLWTKTFGGSNIDIGHSVQQTSDGGFIITGYTRSYGATSGRNVWLIKTDPFGNEQWNNTFGGNDDDEGQSVKQTSDGGYIIAGHTKSFGAGLNDVYLIKTDSLGNQLWTRTFGGSNDDEGYSVLQTADNGYLVAGATSSSGAGGRDVILVKTDSDGNLVWQKTLGGLSSDGAWYINYASDGGYIITGWTFSHGPGFLGNAWLLKVDSLGNEQWNSAFGGTDADRGYSVQQSSDGGYILTGYTSSFGAGLTDMLLIKTDDAGNQIWMKTFGGTGRDYGYSVQQTMDGGFIIAGYTLSFGAGGDDVWIVKTDIDGNEQWNKTYGGSSSDIAYSVKETSDGGYIITGHTLSFGAGVHDVWLIRLDTVIPVELASFTASVSGNSVNLKWSTASEVNNAGFEIERKVFSPQSAVNNFDYERIGFVEGKGTTTESTTYLFVDNNLTPGSYQYRIKQIDFDGSFEYFNLTETVVIAQPNTFELAQNYPNPFNASTVIRYQIPDAGYVRLSVINVLGIEVERLVDKYQETGGYEVTFNNDDIASGIYILALQYEKSLVTKKMVILK